MIQVKLQKETQIELLLERQAIQITKRSDGSYAFLFPANCEVEMISCPQDSHDRPFIISTPT